jgi:hypothetical protein
MSFDSEVASHFDDGRRPHQVLLSDGALFTDGETRLALT